MKIVIAIAIILGSLGTTMASESLEPNLKVRKEQPITNAPLPFVILKGNDCRFKKSMKKEDFATIARYCIDSSGHYPPYKI